MIASLSQERQLLWRAKDCLVVRRFVGDDRFQGEADVMQLNELYGRVGLVGMMARGGHDGHIVGGLDSGTSQVGSVRGTEIR